MKILIEESDIDDIWNRLPEVIRGKIDSLGGLIKGDRLPEGTKERFIEDKKDLEEVLTCLTLAQSLFKEQLKKEKSNLIS